MTVVFIGKFKGSYDGDGGGGGAGGRGVCMDVVYE